MRGVAKTCKHPFDTYVGDIKVNGVDHIVVRCSKCGAQITVPLYARDRQGERANID